MGSSPALTGTLVYGKGAGLKRGVLGAGRQRHDNGNPQLLAQMSRAFNIPDAKASTASNGAQAGAFQRFIYLTQARCARPPLPHACGFIVASRTKQVRGYRWQTRRELMKQSVHSHKSMFRCYLDHIQESSVTS